MAEQTLVTQLEERDFWEQCIKDAADRAGIDVSGTIGNASLHLIVEAVERMKAANKARDELAAEVGARRDAGDVDGFNKDLQERASHLQSEVERLAGELAVSEATMAGEIDVSGDYLIQLSEMKVEVKRLEGRCEFYEMLIEAKAANVGMKVSVNPGKQARSIDYLAGWYACEGSMRLAMLATIQIEKVTKYGPQTESSQ